MYLGHRNPDLPLVLMQNMFPKVHSLLKYMGSSTETVAFQVYEILKINHEFLQFF